MNNPKIVNEFLLLLSHPCPIIPDELSLHQKYWIMGMQKSLNMRSYQILIWTPIPFLGISWSKMMIFIPRGHLHIESDPFHIFKTRLNFAHISKRKPLAFNHQLQWQSLVYTKRRHPRAMRFDAVVKIAAKGRAAFNESCAAIGYNSCDGVMSK